MWRDAKKEQPHTNKNVLVYAGGQNVWLGQWHGSGEWYWFGYGYGQSVTHWQPLPDPPKPTQEDEP